MTHMIQKTLEWEWSV